MTRNYNKKYYHFFLFLPGDPLSQHTGTQVSAGSVDKKSFQSDKLLTICLVSLESTEPFDFYIIDQNRKGQRVILILAVAVDPRTTSLPFPAWIRKELAISI